MKTMPTRVRISGGAKLKVLLIPLEFKTWENASHFPYPYNFGFEEGFAANGVEVFTIPANYRPASAPASISWLRYVKELCAGGHFDQVWFEMIHSYLDDPLLDWITTIAPVRLGIIYESLEINPQEYVNNPEGTKRRETNFQRHLQYVTHILACDEKDVERFNTNGPMPALWFAGGAIPSRFIYETPPSPKEHLAAFYGAVYGERKVWLNHPSLKNLLVRPDASPDFMTDYPRLFDELQRASDAFLSQNPNEIQEFFNQYTDGLRRIRSECFTLWLKGLQISAASVNLPQFGKMYAGRVVEAMAAGRPVITCEILDRPRTKALFENGKEILLYSQDDPSQLALQISSILDDPELACQIAANARRKLNDFHTMEKKVQGVLNWVETGHEPDFGESRQDIQASSPSFRETITIKPPKSERQRVKSTTLDQLRDRSLWHEGQPLRLHLGCGEQHFDGYVNIDYPPSEHTVMAVKADLFADLKDLDFLSETVDEIRLHHVFEHFNRVHGTGYADTMAQMAQDRG